MKKRFFTDDVFKKVLFIISLLLVVAGSFAQTTPQLLQKAFQQFEDDSQLKYAVSSFYVIDAKTGKVVFDKNSRVGLAPASTQKIITSVTSFELLGKDYRFKTQFLLAKTTASSHSILLIVGSGDPTFGSWRYNRTTDSAILSMVNENSGPISPSFIYAVNGRFGSSSVPDGYMWQDIGNYYGSGHYQLNWKENQFDVSFKSFDEGTLTKLAALTMDTTGYVFINEVKSGPVGSGDNAYAYSAPNTRKIFLRGTVPPNQSSFTISASDADPTLSFERSLKKFLTKNNKAGRNSNIQILSTTDTVVNGIRLPYYDPVSNGILLRTWSDYQPLYTHYSPTLDSIIYWFNKKSINLYGEALIKAMVPEKQGYATTDSGVAVVQRFWKEHGIDENELNIADGSGLSPINRVTTHAQVEILKYARDKDWFPYFYNALPEYNAMKMKSGTIRDVKGFCGYHKAKDGNEYIFSFLVNNYNGPASMLVNKMYKVLDTLK